MKIKRIGFEYEADIISIRGTSHDIFQIVKKLHKMNKKDELDFSYILLVKGLSLEKLRRAYNSATSSNFDKMFPIQAIWIREKAGFIVVRQTARNSDLLVGSILR